MDAIQLFSCQMKIKMREKGRKKLKLKIYIHLIAALQLYWFFVFLLNTTTYRSFSSGHVRFINEKNIQQKCLLSALGAKFASFLFAFLIILKFNWHIHFH